MASLYHDDHGNLLKRTSTQTTDWHRTTNNQQQPTTVVVCCCTLLLLALVATNYGCISGIFVVVLDQSRIGKPLL
jgi:hypothetical protein